MKYGLPQNWCVKNDGSLLFKNTVIKHMNKENINGNRYRGNQIDDYYGMREGIAFTDWTTLGAKELSLTQFCKTTKCLTDIVEAVINDICRHSPNKVFTSKDVQAFLWERFGVKMKAVDLRESIHDLRCAGKIKNLVASTKGYWVARNTAEVQKYLEGLQYRAMRIHELQAAIKTQAEEYFGHQVEIPLE